MGTIAGAVSRESRRRCRQPKALEKAKLRKLLRTARGHLRDYAMLEMLVETGLRVGELLKLTVDDVEINERSGKAAVRRGEHENYREVPFTLDVRKAFSAYLDEQHPERENPEAPLWMGMRGGLSHRSSVTRLLEKYSIRAEIEPVNPHALRHTFATRYFDANPSDLRGLARLLGHKSLDTVMIYTESSMQGLTERMERVEVTDV